MVDLVEKYLNRVKGLKEPATYEKRAVDLRNFTGWLDEQGYDDVASLDTLDLEDYFIHQNNQGYAPETVGGRYQSIKSLYDYLADKRDLYEDSPFDGLTRSDYVNGSGSKKFERSGIVYVTPEEKEAMVENVSAPTLRNELLLRLLWQTGMRRGEVVGVELGDIDPEHRAIEVWSSKTNETRTVYYQPSLDLLMDQWLDGGYRSSYRRADDLPDLFITREGRLTENQVGAIVRKAAEAAGIQEILYVDANGHERRRITAHAFRHGHAVQALKSDIDIRTVQKHLGHKKLEMTTKYLQLIDSDVKDAYRRFESGRAEG